MESCSQLYNTLNLYKHLPMDSDICFNFRNVFILAGIHFWLWLILAYLLSLNWKTIAMFSCPYIISQCIFHNFIHYPSTFYLAIRSPPIH